MKILLVNPPVYDFALHDFWLKPYGLLRIASGLRKLNIPFDFFDFLDRGHPTYENLKLKTDEFGRGKFYYEEVKKPDVISFVPRKFKRYGLKKEKFLEETSNGDYDFIFITTGMTYWYLGVKEVVETAKERWKKAKIVVGGISATLMPDFYRDLGADYVVEGDDWSDFGKTFFPFDPTDCLPDYGVYRKLYYGVIRLIEGCPFRCLYCASYKLKPKVRLNNPSAVAELIEKLYAERGIKDLVFYDDALLFYFDEGLKRLHSELKERGLEGKLRFHTPNALHVRRINEEVAYLLKEMGFETIYLGVETVNPALLKKVGEKLSFSEFERAVDNLKKAGFSGEQITAYLFLGLPGQTVEEIEENIKVIVKYGIRVSLSEFSLIPGTPLGDQVIREHHITDPLLTNNSVFPVLSLGFDTVNYLKNLKRSLEKKFLSTSN